MDNVKDAHVFTPKEDSGYSALTNFAHSLLEKLSRKEEFGESTKSNDNYRSGKTGQGAPTTDSGKKSCRKHRKHRKTNFKKSTRKNLAVEQMDKDKSGNISELGGRIIKNYHKPNASPRPVENSVEVENENQKTARSIKLDHKRRRSKTGDQIKGLAFKVTHVGNFVEDNAEDSQTDM